MKITARSITEIEGALGMIEQTSRAHYDQRP